MANIKKLTLDNGETRYRLRYYVGRTGGKQTVKTETFRKKRDADKRDREICTMKDKGVLVVPSKETLDKYLRRWLKEVKEGRVRGRTLYDYQGIVRRYITDPPKGTPPIGGIKLHKLTAGAFEGLYDYLWREMHLAPRTVQYLHTVLRQALKHAVEVGALAKNPTDGVTPQSEAIEFEDADDQDDDQERKINSMTEQEATRFLGAAQGDRYYALWCVLLTGGLRPGEALGLKWKDVDFDEGRVHVRRSLTRRGIKGPWKLTKPKTAKARRSVPLPAMAMVALRAWRVRQSEERLLLGSEYENNEFVFANEFGRPLHGANLSRRNFRRILEAAELGSWEGEGKERRFQPGFRVYDLRHTTATLLLKAGENAKVVQERLGHASIVLTLDTYSDVLPTMQESAAEKMEAMFGVGA